MASLTAKVLHGHKYFQIITSRRINGKPRQVVLAHLGTADTLFARLQQKQGEPIKARVQPFGFLAAAWGLAQKLQLVSLIDRHVPKRQQGASVGQYLVLAALNRLTSPNSKARMAQWYRKTRSEEHTSELQSPYDLVCRLLLEKKKKKTNKLITTTQYTKMF